jgi:hypothetical protein
MNRLPKAVLSRERAAALIIVLAFVVLLTGLAVAYLSRTTSDRQVAHSSFNQSNVDQLAQSAMDNIIGDLRQEILNGSGSPSPTASPVTLFVPTSNANMVPMRNPTPTPGTTPAIPNLIRRSIRSEAALWPDSVNGPALGSRASAVNSTADASANGRSITLARWNSHYLVPKSNTTDAGSDPITTGFSAPNYWAPDWVFVTAAGATPSPAPANVIGRFAYAIYDEGGLLDMNAAGYPSPTTILQYGRKGSLAFADLTALGSDGLSPTASDNVVGWRNYASCKPSGTLSPPNSNLSFSANATNTYYNFILSDPNYIQLTNYFTSSALTYFTNSFLRTSQAPVFNNRTDQALAARQQLIKLRSAVVSGGISFSNALQYLGTLSREGLANIPQWSPATPDSINPNFQTLLVTGLFTRNDGTIANVGDYLVNKRFLLQRLNWFTYKGPSHARTIPTSAPNLGGCIPVSAACAPDYDMWLLTRSNGITFGLTAAFLQQGTDLSEPGQTASTANIYKYFGLVWDSTNERWNYIGHPATPSATSPLASSIATFGVGGTQPATREPDFFELLQAGIINGSLGDSASSYPELPTAQQNSRMLHILTIGANLIAQTRADSYPVRIACSVGGTTMEAIGAPRLPYINSLAACPVGVTATSGGMNWLLIPNLWDPFRDTWDLIEQNTGNSGNGPLSTPGNIRPPIRITIKGTGASDNATVGFGATSTVANSGRVNPVSAFSSVTVSPSSQTLTTGNSIYGRDGFLQAMRMGVSDLVSTLPSFNPTTLGSTTPSWNRVAPPANDGSTRTDNYAVFRLSAPIPAGTTGYPVLILNPGFQITIEYQSPVTSSKWYSYSYLQGNNATATWISSPLNIATNYSQYGMPPGNTAPTIVKSATSNPTRWDQATTGGVAALAQAPMFAKADPRSIRYNTQIGTLTLAANSAGITGSIWPSAYTSTPTMPPGTNPATYSQTTGDNAPAVVAGARSDPYGEGETNGDTVRPVMINRPFRSIGEMSYAFRDQPFRTLSFSWAPTSPNPDAGLLDLFSVNDYADSSGMRGGVISLNSRQAPALGGVLTGAVAREHTPRGTGGAPLPTPAPLASPSANSVATSLTLSTISTPLVNKAELATLIANETGLGPTVPKTERESIARALGETAQTRTWNLLIDVITQSGKYVPGASSVSQADKFVVDGEQRYWVHVAIDRFTGQVIDKQIEVVNE